MYRAASFIDSQTFISVTNGRTNRVNRLLAHRFVDVRNRRRGVVATATSALLIAAAMNAASIGFVSPAQAADSKAKQQQINSQISQLRNQLGEASEEYADIAGRLDEINNRKADLDGQITTLQQQMDGVQRELDDASNTLAQVQSQVAQAEGALQVAESDLDASTNKMREQAVDAYVGRDPGNRLSNFVFKAEDMRQLTAAGEYLDQLVEQRRETVERHKELAGQAQDLKAQIDQKKAEAVAARDVIVQKQNALAGQKAELDGLHAQVQGEVDNQAKLLSDVQGRKAEIENQMAVLQQQSDSIGALLRGTGGKGSTLPPGRGVLSNPAPGYPLTSNFGMRQDPVLNSYRLHAGIDFGVPTGVPIHAAADGTVVTAGPVTGYGNYTCINHGGALATCYAHQSKIQVTVGQHVTRGQIIGLVGSTGYATGPHLHFEVRVNGNPVDPLGYL